MAYFIGLMASDGNLYHKTSYMIRINLKSSDVDILNKIRDNLNIGTVKIIERKNYDKIQKSALFRINNKSLYNKLLEIGLTPNKSLTLQWPKIPKEYYRDFVRGFFDGDGSISFNKASDYKGAWRAVFYSASKDFIYKLKDILNQEANIISENLNKHTACYA
jgi:intein/homing endonuclease